MTTHEEKLRQAMRNGFDQAALMGVQTSPNEFLEGVFIENSLGGLRDYFLNEPKVQAMGRELGLNIASIIEDEYQKARHRHLINI